MLSVSRVLFLFLVLGRILFLVLGLLLSPMLSVSHGDSTLSILPYLVHLVHLDFMYHTHARRFTNEYVCNVVFIAGDPFENRPSVS